jgi:L-fuconolactonase
VFEPNIEWLSKYSEATIDPERPVIDSHHHLWDYGSRYFLDEYMTDLNTGHRVVATVHVQCGFNYSVDTDPLLAPVCETEFVNGIAAMSASGRYGTGRVCAGIIGFADLTAGAEVGLVLEAHLRASGRFRGIRQIAIWDSDSRIKSVVEFPKELLLDSTFRQGYACLGRFGLSFETWIWHRQIPELADLARSFPDTPVILNHIGTPLGIGSYAGKDKEVFLAWRDGLAELARCPNTYIKVSGLGMHFTGATFETNECPPSSEQLARSWARWFDTCIALFAVDRCMFGSNFPVDKMYCSYAVLWNAFKRLAAPLSEEEKSALFYRTARTVYRLSIPVMDC